MKVIYRLVSPLAAVTALLLLVACGSEPLAQPNTTPDSPAATATVEPITTPAVRIVLNPTKPPAKTDCPPIPESENMTVAATCTEGSALQYTIEATGFQPEEALTFKLMAPNGEVLSDDETEAMSDGGYYLSGSFSRYPPPPTGLYTIVVEGKVSEHKATGYFYFERK
jgi:hypothetical protein